MVIELKTLDDRVDGRIFATTHSDRGTHVYKIPKSMIDMCIDDIYKSNGIYFLVDTKHKKVYVGKAERRANGEGIVNRANEKDESHKRISNWDYLVFVTDVSKGISQFYNDATLGYMEYAFYQTIHESKKYECVNKQEPHHRDPDDKEPYDKVVESCKSIFYALGFDFLTTKMEFNVNNVDDKFIFEMRHKGYVGKLAYDKNNNEYWLLNGSDIIKSHTKSCYKWIIESREKIKKHIKTGKLTKDILFDNPSRAAGVVAGASMNGREVWKNRNGKSLGDIIKT